MQCTDSEYIGIGGDASIFPLSRDSESQSTARTPCKGEDEAGNIIQGEMERKRKFQEEEKRKEGPEHKKSKMEVRPKGDEVEERTSKGKHAEISSENENSLAERQRDIQRTGIKSLLIFYINMLMY